MISPDRRAAPRHRPQAVRVHLVWKEGEELRHAVAQLRDISRGGAALRLEGPSPSRGPVVLALEGSPVAHWILAEVAGIVTADSGGVRLGLKFPEACPNRFFRGALGGEPEAAAGTARAATDPDSCWSRRSKRSRDTILGRDRPRDSRWLADDPLLPPLDPAALVGALH